jgi:hypothetical protein
VFLLTSAMKFFFFGKMVFLLNWAFSPIRRLVVFLRCCSRWIVYSVLRLLLKYKECFIHKFSIMGSFCCHALGQDQP